MSEIYLKNYGELQGIYLDKYLETESNTVETLIVRDIHVKKTANREAWSSDGSSLEYTVVIENETGVHITDAVFQDYLDVELVELVEDSVFVNGLESDYTYSSGYLRIELGTVGKDAIEIKFKVKAI